MGALALLWVVGASASGGLEVRVEHLPCFSGTRVQQALEARLGTVAAAHVDVARQNEMLSVTLRRAGFALMTRDIAFRPDECRELEQTVTLLVLSWWNSAVAAVPPQLRTAIVASSAEPSPSPAPPKDSARVRPAPTAKAETAARETAAPGSAPDVAAAETPVPQPVQPERADAAEPAVAPAPPPIPVRVAETESASPPPLAAAAPPAASTPPAPRVAAESPTVVQISAAATEVSPSPRRWMLSADLRGLGTFDGSAVAGGLFTIDGGLANGLGASLDIGIESQRATPLSSGEIDVWLSYLTLLARYRLEVGTGRWAFLFALGARGYRIAASAQGFANLQPAVLFTAAGVASVGAQLQLWRGLFAILTIEGFLRLRTEQLEIQGVNAEVTLGQTGGTATLGLGWRFP